jgi:hypothetical protein
MFVLAVAMTNALDPEDILKTLHCPKNAQSLLNTLQSHGGEANEYTHYADPNYEFRTPLQSILLNDDLLDILSVFLVYTNAKVDYYVVGSPPLHMAIVCSWCRVCGSARHSRSFQRTIWALQSSSCGRCGSFNDAAV